MTNSTCNLAKFIFTFKALKSDQDSQVSCGGLTCTWSFYYLEHDPLKYKAWKRTRFSRCSLPFANYMRPPPHAAPFSPSDLSLCGSRSSRVHYYSLAERAIQSASEQCEAARTSYSQFNRVTRNARKLLARHRATLVRTASRCSLADCIALSARE